MDSPESPARPRIRLQRFLAACGLGSRRACEEFITQGRITVDGETVAELGATVDPSSQTIALDGERLRMERKKYYVLHKPPGYLCTNSDPAGRRKAIDLLPSEGPRLFTVGRLDENSTGLLVVTNDGDLAEKLAHPRNQIFRTYHIQVAGHPTREIYESLKEGLRFAEGRFRVRSIKSIKKIGQSTWLEVILSEGHNRELRRLFARVGHKILKLARIAFGPIRLGKLKMGEFRDLSIQELEALHGIVANVRQRSRERPRGSEPEYAPLFETKGTREDSGKRKPAAKDGRRPSTRDTRTRDTKGRPAAARPESGKRPDSKSAESRGGGRKEAAGKRSNFRPKRPGGGRPRTKRSR